MDLTTSVIKRDISNLKCLIDNGININCADNDSGMTPLMYIFDYDYGFEYYYDKSHMLEFLLEHGANVNANYKNSDSIFMMAINNDAFFKDLELLIKYGANINYQNNDGYSPLHIACMDNYSDIVELLLNNNANINQQSNDGDTALIIASKNGNYNIIRLLLDKCE